MDVDSDQQIRPTSTCERRPADSDGWIRSTKAGCIDRLWACSHATLDQWLRDLGRADPTAALRVKQGDIAYMEMANGGYLLLMSDIGCSQHDVLSMNHEWTDVLRLSAGFKTLPATK